MYKPIRRTDRALTSVEAYAVLVKAEYGVLSTISADGAPYGVPLSYALLNGAIYFHCATEGHKLENIARDGRVSFTAVGDTAPVHKGKMFSTFYESALVLGTAEEVTEEGEKCAALMALVQKYFPQDLADGEEAVEALKDRTKIVKIAIEHITGKAKRG